jgi:dolichyl-phosphate beta-glucosyltransferase
MDLSVVIPAYNEAERIEATLSAVASYFEGQGRTFELVIADDGSADSTLAVVERWQRAWLPQSRFGSATVVQRPHQGKGAAVAAGVAAARGKWILMTDADLSAPITEWPKLEQALAEGAAIAVGSRQTLGSEIEVRQPWWRQSLGLAFGLLVRKVFPVGVVDSQCGFKAFPAAVAKELFAGLSTPGFCFDVEILLKARSRGLKVSEVPVKWRNHPDSRVRVFREWPRVIGELWRIRRTIPRSAGPRPGQDAAR